MFQSLGSRYIYNLNVNRIITQCFNLLALAMHAQNLNVNSIMRQCFNLLALAMSVRNSNVNSISHNVSPLCKINTYVEAGFTSAV